MFRHINNDINRTCFFCVVILSSSYEALLGGGGGGVSLIPVNLGAFISYP